MLRRDPAGGYPSGMAAEGGRTATMGMIERGPRGFTIMDVMITAGIIACATAMVVPAAMCRLDRTKELESRIDALYCANVRAGRSFAVADAYRRWYDVDEGEAREILVQLGHRASG